MFGKVTAELDVTIKVGTNDESKFKDKKELIKWLEEQLVEFEVKVNSESTVRVHIGPYEP